MKLLCNVTRGKNIESRHEVYAVAIDEYGKIIFSIILGFGIAALFRKACKNRDCIIIKSPNHNINNNIYRHENQCYKYKSYTVSCK